MKPKVGLITTMAPGKSWPRETLDKVCQDNVMAKLALQAIGLEIVTGSEGISRTKSEMVEHGKILRSKGIEALVLYVGSWTYANTAVALADIVDVPILVWTYSAPGNIGIVGGSIVRGALDEIGVKNTLVHGGFKDPQTLTKLRKWCVGCAAAMRLRGSTLGVGGSRGMGMFTTHVDPSDVSRKFGIDIEGWDQGDLIQRSKEIPDNDVQGFSEWMKQEFGRVEVPESLMNAQIKMYLALKQLVQERGFDFVCVKCMPELPSQYTTFCVAHALLNDTNDAQGHKECITCGCEADVNGAITMQMLKNVCGGPTMFADFLLYNERENMATLCNCGSMPTDFAPTKKDVHWVLGNVAEYEWKMGAASPQYVAKPGLVTMARLGRIAGEYIMLILKGLAVSYPRKKLAEVNPQQPQAFVRLQCDPDDFIAELRANHIHVAYGDYVDELELLCKTLDIRPIVLSQT